jgi:hypothetical protein
MSNYSDIIGVLFILFLIVTSYFVGKKIDEGED